MENLALASQTILFVAFITSIIFFVALGRAKWKMGKDEWFYGEPPYDIPRSFITTGMVTDPNNPRGVISTWKYNSSYYQYLND